MVFGMGFSNKINERVYQTKRATAFGVFSDSDPLTMSRACNNHYNNCNSHFYSFSLFHVWNIYVEKRKKNANIQFIGCVRGYATRKIQDLSYKIQRNDQRIKLQLLELHNWPIVRLRCCRKCKRSNENKVVYIYGGRILGGPIMGKP